MAELKNKVFATQALEQYGHDFLSQSHIVMMSRVLPHVLRAVGDQIPGRDADTAGKVAILCKLIERSGLPSGWQDRAASRQMITTAADRFEVYLVDVIGDLYWSKPDLIPRADLANDLTWLEGREREERIVEVAEREIDRMAGKPFGDLIQKACETLGIDPDLDTDLLERARIASEHRHIIVHYGSRVSFRFLQETGREDVQLGQLIEVPFPQANAMAESFFDVAVRVDQALVIKYGIECFASRRGKRPESQIDPRKIEEVRRRLEGREG